MKPFGKLIFVLILIALFLSSEQASAKERKKLTYDREISLFAGMSYLFLDMNQFDEDLSTFGLKDFGVPMAARIGMGNEMQFGKHAVISGVDGTIMALKSHNDGKLASFSHWYVLWNVGYDFEAARWFDVFVKFSVGPGSWDYQIVSRSVNGRANGVYIPIQPEAGIMFSVPERFGIKLKGGYHFNAGKGRELYSGDFTRDNFDKLDLNGAVFVIEFTTLFPILKSADLYE